MSAQAAADTPAALPGSEMGAEFDMSAGPPVAVARTFEAAYKPGWVAHIREPAAHIPGLVGNTLAPGPRNTAPGPHNTAPEPHTRDMDMDKDSNTGRGVDDTSGCQDRCQRLPLRLGAESTQKPKPPKRQK